MLVSLVVVGAVGGATYLGPGRDWLAAAGNTASDAMQDVADGQAKRGDDGKISDSGKIEGSSLEVGDCLMAAELGSTFYNAKVTPCTDAHDAQIVGQLSTGVTAAEPTEDEMFEGCAAEVPAYVGPGWESMGVSVGVITIDQVVGTRILCLLETDDGQPTLTQSLEGQG